MKNTLDAWQITERIKNEEKCSVQRRVEHHYRHQHTYNGNSRRNRKRERAEAIT